MFTCKPSLDREDGSPYRGIAAVDVGHVIPRDHENEAGGVLFELCELSHLTAGLGQNGLVVCV